MRCPVCTSVLIKASGQRCSRCAKAAQLGFRVLGIMRSPTVVGRLERIDLAVRSLFHATGVEHRDADEVVLRRILAILDGGSFTTAGNVISKNPDDYDGACMEQIRAALDGSEMAR